MSRDVAAPPSPQEVQRKLSVHTASPMPIPSRTPSKRGSISRTTTSPAAAPLSSSQTTYQTTFSSESDSDTSAMVSPMPAHHTLPSFSEGGSALGVIEERRTGVGSETEEEDAEASEGEVDEGGLRDELVVKSGYLYKKGERRKTWKKRWFVLRPAKLAYYKTSAEYRLLHLMPTSTISEVTPVQLKKYGHAFALITPSRTFYVRAETEREAQDWVTALRQTLREARAEEEEELEQSFVGPPGGGNVVFPAPLVTSSDSDDPQFVRGRPGQHQRTVSTSPSTRGILTRVISNVGQGGGPPLSPTGGTREKRDPNKPIAQGYMTKMGKRKQWRKRWFVLRESGLEYGKSHMDTKGYRKIPMAEILHALEYEPPDAKHAHHNPLLPHSPQQPALSTSADASVGALPPDSHVFKVVTAQRTFLMCAPSEEEEIKWLSALRACIARTRGEEADGSRRVS